MLQVPLGQVCKKVAQGISMARPGTKGREAAKREVFWTDVLEQNGGLRARESEGKRLPTGRLRGRGEGVPCKMRLNSERAAFGGAWRCREVA